RTKSTSLRVFLATFIMKSPSLCFGLWMPGVSMNTIWLSSVVTTPWTFFLVAWGLSLMIAIFWPTTRLRQVDFPTFVRPMIEINPDLYPSRLFSIFHILRLERAREEFPDRSLLDIPLQVRQIYGHVTVAEFRNDLSAGTTWRHRSGSICHNRK